MPEDVAKGVDFRNIIEFRPAPGNAFIAGHKGHLIRNNFKGQINDADQAYLLGLSTSQHWKKQVNFLVQECRKVEGPELIKASLLIGVSLSILASLAVACSTRMGLMATFLTSVLALGVGLSADQIIRPWAREGSRWAGAIYPFIPNFQFFWMIDALSDERVIPWQFIGHAVGYAALYTAALLALGMSLFETREVG